jgi:hypothetical protein
LHGAEEVDEWTGEKVEGWKGGKVEGWNGGKAEVEVEVPLVLYY